MVRVDSPFFARLATSGCGFHPTSLLYMAHFFRLPALASFLFSAGSLLSSPVAHAQVAVPTTVPAVHGYDFLTVTSMESGAKSLAKLLIVPAFQGKSEIQLEDFGGFSTEKNIAKLQHNTELIQHQLSDLTVAGWELVQTYPFINSPSVVTTRYLFRKAKS